MGDMFNYFCIQISGQSQIFARFHFYLKSGIIEPFLSDVRNILFPRRINNWNNICSWTVMGPDVTA